MKIAIAGGSGFIGSKLTDHFTKNGHTVYILTRNKPNRLVKTNVHYIEWLHKGSKPDKELEGIDVFINLAGESIGDGRWTPKRKKAILNSRINSTRAVIQLLSNMKQKPSVLINASAIGYYGNSVTETFTESSKPIGNNFLTNIVRTWENEASKAADLGIRVVYARLGIVLDEKNGALQQIILPYKLFAGGTIGSGKQWLSWIHIDDVVGMIDFAIQRNDLNGPFNLTAPKPSQMKEFGKTVASVLKRPHWLPVPAFMLKIFLGEMSTLVLEGQYVKSEKAKQFHYSFQYETLTMALKNLYKK